MVEVQIRRPCSERCELERSSRSNMPYAQCPECRAKSYRRDEYIEHDSVEEFIGLVEFARLLEEERSKE